MKNLISQYEKLSMRLREIEVFIDFVISQKKFISNYKDNENFSSFFQDDDVINFFSKLELIPNSPVQYNAIIISIYAAFENFIDDLSREYIKFCFTNRLKEPIHNSIKSNYFYKAGEFFQNPGRYDKNIDKHKISASLLDFYRKNKNENFCFELFLRHSSNLTIKNVDEFFRTLGITDIKNKINENYQFKKYMAEDCNIPLERVENYLKNISKNNFNKLDELVGIRNSVAHGWIIDDRMSFIDIKNTLLPFFNVICESMLEIFLEYLFLNLYKSKKARAFGKTINVYRNNIICLNSKSSKIHENDYIFYKKENIFKILKIKSIEHQSVKRTSVENENIDIGIMVDRNIKREYSFYYKN